MIAVRYEPMNTGYFYAPYVVIYNGDKFMKDAFDQFEEDILEAIEDLTNRVRDEINVDIDLLADQLHEFVFNRGRELHLTDTEIEECATELLENFVITYMNDYDDTFIVESK